MAKWTQPYTDTGYPLRRRRKIEVDIDTLPPNLTLGDMARIAVAQGMRFEFDLKPKDAEREGA